MLYCYTTEGGMTLDLPFPMGKAPASIELETGEIARRDIAAEHGSVKTPRRLSVNPWPMWSDALGVHTGQVKAAEKYYAGKGIPTDFCSKTGRARITSRQHRNAVMREGHYHDRDAGYGDYAGEH
jgi:hypothetical protein